MTNDNFLWLQRWYQSHCNGDWEHAEQIRIETIDNPGWSISINLQDTELERATFIEINRERSFDDWVDCFVKEGKFEGRCGAVNISEVLQIFREWVERIGARSI